MLLLCLKLLERILIAHSKAKIFTIIERKRPPWNMGFACVFHFPPILAFTGLLIP